jgi:hypothetical protein
MLRRIGLASFVAAVALVVACGHQVTPEPNLDTNNNLAGKMVIRFRTNGPLNFNTYTYAIVIDTCGVGAPLPNVYGTSFFGYSYSFLTGGSYGTAIPALLQYIITPGSSNSLNGQPVILSSTNTELILNSNGQGNEYEIVFTREQLDNPLGVTQPCPNITPAPTASPVSPAPTGATPTPTSQPTTSAQQYWYFNFYTINATNKTIIDSLGIGGPTDNTFNGVGVETGTTNSNPVFKATGGAEPSDPSAQIQGGEIDNYQ